MNETTSQPLLDVAAAQYPLDAVPTLEAWEAKASAWVRTGAATGARLLVFPEYGALELAAAAGLDATSNLQRTLSAVADAQAHAQRVWSDLARRHGVHILAPSGPERRPNGYVNAARLHAPSGQSGVQDKLILTPFEHDWGMVPGAEQRVFDTDIGRIGIAICYDCEFPLLVRTLTEAGAQIVLIPSCTEHTSGYNRVRIGAQARALESQIVTIASPTVGEAPWSAAIDHNCGAAGIFVPPDIATSQTGVVAEGRLDEPGWIHGTVDLARLAAVRTTGEMRNWRDWPQQPGAARPSGSIPALDLRR
jgi:predicted amidohydrolase